MKLLKIIIIVAFLAASHASAVNVNITATAGQFSDDILDASGTPLSAGTAVALVVDTTSNGFGSLSAGTLEVGSFFGDLFVSATSSSADIGGLVKYAEFATASANNPALTQGMQFAILWFPGITGSPQASSSPITISAGAPYGFSTRTDWLLPSDGGSFTGSAGPGGLASSTVVPEPSTYAAIFGLLVLGFAAYRRRIQK